MSADGRIQPFLLAAGDQEPSVLSLAVGADHGIWAGTRGDGVFHIGSNGRVRHYRPGSELPRGNYRAVATGPAGQVWLGSANGVLQLENGRAVPLELSGMPRTVVLALSWLQDALWIGTTEGAWRLQGGQVEETDIATLGAAGPADGVRQLGRGGVVTGGRRLD